MKFKFSGKLTVGVEFEIEAADLNEAEDRLMEIDAGAFTGNDSISGLVGLRFKGQSIPGVTFFVDDCYPDGDLSEV